jgi:hypothetical protein
MFPNSFDHVLPPKQVGIDEISEHIRDLKLIDLNDVAGHVGFLTPKSMSVITREIADLFQRITDGRPGLSEPRISSA